MFILKRHALSVGNTFTMNFFLTTIVLVALYCTPINTKATNSTQLNNPDLQDDDRERIIGGEQALEGELNYQLRLRSVNLHNCGAALIQVEDTLLGLTAAHCTEGWDADEFTLIAGDVRISDKSGREQTRQVSRVVAHEEYDPDTYKNDIALLFIDEPFKVNEFVGPIPLPEAGIDTKGSVIVSGWGAYNYQGWYSDNLTKLEVPVVDDETCKKAYIPLEYEFFDHFLCAGYLGIGAFKDSCKGDSGGPLKSVEGGYLAGIVSWSEGCAHPNFPGVNIEVSYFVEWINDQVAKYTSDSRRDQTLADKAKATKSKS